MSINSYQIFITVTEQGSFIKASHVLNITSSAVSHSIAGLEQEFGYPLLTRNKAGVTLTSYGESLMPYIRSVLNSEAILHQQVASLNGLDTGMVRLGCFNSICTTHLPKLIHKFNELYPNIKIKIFQGTYADVISWLKSGIVEIGFLSKASAENEVPFCAVYKDELFCIVPKKFPVSNSEYITQEEMKSREFIVQQESTNSDIQNYLEKYHLQVKNSSYVSDDLAAVSLVSNGFGICIMPELVMNSINYEVNRYSLQPKGFRTIGISCLEKKNLSPAARKIYEFIIEAYREEWL
ncbi:MAG: LysR family transcriptional regulator [Herbinix sp.]|nr:LysR family transcriptional regulator [Herbinix sp.]